MAHRSDTLAAIEACYDAVFDATLWPDRLQSLAVAAGAASCALRTTDVKHPASTDQRNKTAPAIDSIEHREFTALWREKVGEAPDPHIRHPVPTPNSRFRFIVEEEISTPEERRYLPYYQEIAKPGRRDWWAAIGFMVKDRRWFLSFYRAAEKGPFDPRDEAVFLQMAPHLRRIVSSAEKISDVSIRPSLEALDRVGCPSVILDRLGCVVCQNEHMDALLGSALRIRHRRVRSIDATSDNRLQRLISSASDLSCPVDPVIVERDGVPWLLAEIMPLTPNGHDFVGSGRSMLLFTELRASATLDTKLLISQFRLTRSEARLAAILADGSGVVSASRRLGLGRETIRTQLRSIFSKTGTCRQAELAALLSRLSKTARTH